MITSLRKKHNVSSADDTILGKLTAGAIQRLLIIKEAYMADGKWVMTSEDAKRVDLTFSGEERIDLRKLPNYGKHQVVDDRDGKAERKCALCGSADLLTGFGGCGEGYGYSSMKCGSCGGTTDFVYKDDVGKYF